MSRNSLFGAIFVAVTAALLAGAFRLLGTPSEMAAFQRDRQRVGDLLSIAGAIHLDAFQGRVNPKPLPAALSEGFYNRDSTRDCKDPSTGARYRYQRVSDAWYTLEANFELGSDALVRRGMKLPGPEWTHAPGPLKVKLHVNEDGSEAWSWKYRY